MTRFFYVVLFAMVLPGAAPRSLLNAQDWDCSKPDNLPQQAMNFCSGKDFVQADAELNRVWKTVFAKIRRDDAELDQPFRGMPETLRNAQRAWITFRDMHCETQGFQARGGTLEPLLVNTCRAEMTRQRTKQLNALLEDR